MLHGYFEEGQIDRNFMLHGYFKEVHVPVSNIYQMLVGY